jgi:DNA-binding NtrC family response regulator
MSSEWNPETDHAPPPAGSPVRASRLRLVVLSGPDQGREIELAPGHYTIGKGEGCSLLLTDPAVSRRHLELRVDEAAVVVRDLDSTNGSYFGGARLSEIAVGAGAVITIGGSELKVLPGAGGSAHAVPPSASAGFGGLLGRSLALRQVYALLERVARSNAALLIEGETGTGKERCAEVVHEAGARAAGPFVICDLAGLPRTLIESELFGHLRGAYTGADRDREGAFARAHGGTIFIDEIGELELAIQPRLLRVLEQHKVKPLGASDYRDVDVRVIAASNRDLREEVKAGRFREDLYHRLSVVVVHLPPLREHKEDLRDLVSAFLDGGKVTVHPDTWAVLAAYDWPGNVRELRNVIERGVSLLGGAGVLDPSWLGIDDAVARAPAGPPFPVDDARFHEQKERLIAAWEREYLTKLVDRAGGNMAEAARLAGIDRAYVYRLLKKHGLGTATE